MQYKEIEEQYEKAHICPFCQEKHPHMIYENRHMFIVPTRAPYVEDHLLIIPKRHVILLKELSNPELEDLHELVDIWTNKLHTKHETVNLLLRDGLAGGMSGKSVNHLHFHLIPDCPVGSSGKDGEEREFYSEEQYLHITQHMKKTYGEEK